MYFNALVINSVIVSISSKKHKQLADAINEVDKWFNVKLYGIPKVNYALCVVDEDGTEYYMRDSRDNVTEYLYYTNKQEAIDKANDLMSQGTYSAVISTYDEDTKTHIIKMVYKK